jgi:quercetin dioxygenase-like cupin family protein
MATRVSRQELIDREGDVTFRGIRDGDTGVSYIMVEFEPGQAVRAHRHAYDEIFVVLEGSVTFTVGGDVIHASAGDTVVGPANVPHAFVNSGTGRLRQIDIHASADIVTEWLED